MRRKRNFKRNFEPDIIHGKVEFTRFINYLMERGKKSVAERNFYKSLDIIKERTKKDSMEVVEAAIRNASPLLEVKSRRIGGANYQVPQEVRGERKFALVCRWIIGAARARKGLPMAVRLAEELLLAYKKEGTAFKKREDTHRMAEANRAFAHYRW